MNFTYCTVLRDHSFFSCCKPMISIATTVKTLYAVFMEYYTVRATDYQIYIQ